MTPIEQLQAEADEYGYHKQLRAWVDDNSSTIRVIRRLLAEESVCRCGAPSVGYVDYSAGRMPYCEEHEDLVRHHTTREGQEIP